MRRSRQVGIVIALAVLIAGLGWWTWLPSTAGETPGAQATEPNRVSRRPSGARFDPADWEDPVTLSPRELATPGGTPALKRPATEADGHLEVHVSAAGKPRPSARVRVYLRGWRDPGKGYSEWRFAGGGATDEAGRLRVAARPGTYIVVVRSDGFASARREVLRAAGEDLTTVRVALEPGSLLRGRIVEAKSAVPIALGQLSLSRFAVAASGLSDSPAEEKVFATADALGRFEIAELESGTYRLEATAPSYAKLARDVIVPRHSELLLELSGASFIEGRVLRADGSAAPGADLTVVGGPEIVRTNTGPEGTFST
jgi:hypothetical protein